MNWALQESSYWMNGDKKRKVGSSSSTPMFPFFKMYSSKAEQILSRYRPIAPKPPKPDQQQQNPPDSSSPAVQSTSSVSVGSRKSGRNKRSGDQSLVSPRGSKRSTTANKKEPTKQLSQAPHLQPHQQQQMVPVVVENVTTSVSTVTVEALPGGGGGSRRAASFEDVNMGCGWKKGYNEIFSRNKTTSCANSLSDLGSSSTASGFHMSRSTTGRISPPRLCLSVVQSEVQPQPREEEEQEEDRPKLVTLSLLPDTPSHPDAQEQRQQPEASATTSIYPLDQPLELTLATVPEQRLPDAAVHMPVIDSGYLEQTYGVSSDPVVLTDNNSAVLWSNASYNKVMAERMNGKSQRGPYIDPLGLPTQLGCFRYRLRTGTECKAVLWGFLKKFMLLDNIMKTSPTGSSCEETFKVIAPQPIRPIKVVVGSTVCLDSVSEVDCYSGHLTGSLESIEMRLEKGSVPAFVTDRSNRVRWVNTAYNQLTGSTAMVTPSTSGFASCSSFQQESTSSNSSGTEKVPEVSFMYHCEISPYTTVSLRGQVRIDWVDCGKRCCLTGVPCEMRRLDEQYLGSLYVWTLNLNVGTVRYGHGAGLY